MDIGSFWVARIALVVSILAGVAAVRVTYRVSDPRHRIVCGHGGALQGPTCTRRAFPRTVTCELRQLTTVMMTSRPLSGWYVHEADT